MSLLSFVEYTFFLFHLKDKKRVRNSFWTCFSFTSNAKLHFSKLNSQQCYFTKNASLVSTLNVFVSINNHFFTKPILNILYQTQHLPHNTYSQINHTKTLFTNSHTIFHPYKTPPHSKLVRKPTQNSGSTQNQITHKLANCISTQNQCK